LNRRAGEDAKRGKADEKIMTRGTRASAQIASVASRSRLARQEGMEATEERPSRGKDSDSSARLDSKGVFLDTIPTSHTSGAFSAKSRVQVRCVRNSLWPSLSRWKTSRRRAHVIVRGKQPRLHRHSFIRVHSCSSVVAPSRSDVETPRDPKASPAERRFGCFAALHFQSIRATRVARSTCTEAWANSRTAENFSQRAAPAGGPRRRENSA